MDINRGWNDAQLTNQLLANFPVECRDFPFEIVKNCNGNLVIPNLPSGRKIDAKLLLRSISPTGCVYLRLLQELPYADGTLNPPGLACKQNEESVDKVKDVPAKQNEKSLEDAQAAILSLSRLNNNIQSTNQGHKESPQLFNVKPAAFINDILGSVESDFIDPIEILRFLQKAIVQGRALEVTSLDIVNEGETNFITVDRDNILQTTFIELKYVTNPRLTFQVDFMGEQEVDLGGPRKEWIRLMNQAMKEKYFDNGLRPFLSDGYFFVGQMLAIAMLQNGQIPSFLGEVILQDLISKNTDNKCIFEMQKGLETLGMYTALRKFPQLLHILRPDGQKPLHPQKLIHLFKPTFSEEGSNALKKEKELYHLFVTYIREVAAGRRLCGEETLTLGHILQFATGAAEEPILGFELQPSIEFVLPKEVNIRVFQQPEGEDTGHRETHSSSEVQLPQENENTCEDSKNDQSVTHKIVGGFLPTSPTCINVLKLPRATNQFPLPGKEALFLQYDMAFANNYFGYQ